MQVSPVTTTASPYTTLFRSDHHLDRQRQRIDARRAETAEDDRPDVASLELVGQDGVEDGLGQLVAAVGDLHAIDLARVLQDRKSTRLNSSHLVISYAVLCLE